MRGPNFLNRIQHSVVVRDTTARWLIPSLLLLLLLLIQFSDQDQDNRHRLADNEQPQY